MSEAVIPRLISRRSERVGAHVLAISLGVLLLSVLSKISIHLPFTPVPITGQTFGVAFLALLMGSRLAVPVLTAYLGLGAAGLPVFAQAAHGWSTVGYLIGMWAASLLVGWLADRGWAQRFSTALVAAYLGSVVIFACGLAVLSYFIPASGLLGAGLYPFMIGDLIKNVLAASLVAGIGSAASSAK